MPHTTDQPTIAATTVPLWIDGAQAVSTSGRTGDVSNPATGQTIRTVPYADASDVDRAVQAALRAFPDWSGTTALPPNVVITLVG